MPLPPNKIYKKYFKISYVILTRNASSFHKKTASRDNIFCYSGRSLHFRFYFCRSLLRIAIRPMHRITTPKISETRALLLKPATTYVKKETTATVMA